MDEPAVYSGGEDKEVMRKMEAEREFIEDNLRKAGDNAVSERALKSVSISEEEKRKGRDEWRAADRLYEAARELFRNGELSLKEAISQLSESLSSMAGGVSSPKEEEKPVEGKKPEEKKSEEKPEEETTMGARMSEKEEES